MSEKVNYDKQHDLATIAAGTAAIEFRLDGSRKCRGRLEEIEIIIPTLTNDVTMTLTITRANGTVAYASPALSRTTKTLLLVSRWVSESDVFALTPSGAVGGIHTCNVIPRIIG
jgi:hypothetical protein